ncbi:MAG: patatin-like phospholipase family protein [Bacteroidales bacterium]|nr:patatin-like phospholipase family protein [Bacteroidales bacterium]
MKPLIDRQILLFLFSSIILINSFTTRAQISTTNKERPKVGVVLSGGGAKGIAHIGVLKILEEVGMPIDYIGGTSMGSLVSALYSIGYSIDSMEAIIRSENWEYLLSDNILREELSITEKQDDDRFLLSFPINKQGINLPAGIIRGQHIENTFTELCSPAYKTRDFSKLPIPFLCIALDINTGEKIVLKKGNLSEAMRASMSIPSVFVPKEIDGHVLVDGGLIDNFPVEDVKAMGADIIIGVDVGHGSQENEEKLSILTIMNNAMFLYSEKIMKESLKSVDIFIQPELHGLSTASFSSGDSLMVYGEEAGKKVYKQLKELADSINSFGGIKYERKELVPVDSVFIKSIQVNGLVHMTKKLVTADLPFSVLEWVKITDITKAVENIYASNYFNKVTYELVSEDDGTRLLLKFQEKENGFLRFGLYYDSDYFASLFLNTTFYNTIAKNSKLSITAGLGRTPSLDFLYFIDKGPSPAPGIDLYGQYSILNIFSDSTSKKLAAVNSYYLSSRVFLQSNFSSFLYLRAGAEWLHYKFSPNISLIDFGNLIENYYTIFFETHFDTYERAYYPTRGNQGNLIVKIIGNGINNPIFYSRFDYRFAQKLSKKLVLNPSFYGGGFFTDSSSLAFGFPIGGMTNPGRLDNFPFIGYKYFELSGNLFLSGRIDLRYNIYKSFYLSLLGNVGFYNDILGDLFNNDSFISGYGLSIGIDTPIGPINASLMKSGERSALIGHIQIGFWF